jgi:hypothetical protein
MAQVRRLAAALLLVALAGCGGSSSPEPPSGGDSLRLALPLVPRTLDPAKVVDLSSVNVAHELYAGLTRFSGNGVEPDLAESWEHDERGLVWTFHLRDDLRWSDDRPLTAEDFRRSWLRALSPELGSAYARAEMQNIAGARRYRVTGTGDVGVEAVDERTLRVTLAHPVPWLDEQVAWPVFFPVPDGGKATSGPFRLAERSAKRLVLERNFNYWNVNAVKPKRLELTAEAESADAILPRGIAAPGFHWIETGGNAPPPARGLAVAATGLLWFVTRGTPLAKRHTREYVAWVLTHLDLGVPPVSLIPDEIPGASFINSHRVVSLHTASPPLTLSLSYTTQDRASVAVVGQLRRLAPQLRQFSLTVVPKPVPTLRELLGLAGHGPRSRAWSSCCSAGAPSSSTRTTSSTSFRAAAPSTSPSGATALTTEGWRGPCGRWTTASAGGSSDSSWSGCTMRCPRSGSTRRRTASSCGRASVGSAGRRSASTS